MRSVLTLFLLAATVASAQFSFPSYKPSQCMVTAQELAIEGTTDGKVIAIACAGIKVPLLGTELYLGIDMAQGTAPVWFYVVRSEQRDSVAGTALIRMTDVCSTPPIEDIPDAADVGEYGEEAIPTTFIEGKELVDKVNANGDYVKFHAAHPDTLPTAEEFFENHARSLSMNLLCTKSKRFAEEKEFRVIFYACEKRGGPIYKTTDDFVILQADLTAIVSQDAIPFA